MEDPIVKLKLKLSDCSNILDDIRTVIEIVDEMELTPPDYDKLVSILTGLSYLYEERIQLADVAFSRVADEFYAGLHRLKAAQNQTNVSVDKSTSNSTSSSYPTSVSWRKIS
jgi:chromosomal replication initiation ATPase DnaA